MLRLAWILVATTVGTAPPAVSGAPSEGAAKPEVQRPKGNAAAASRPANTPSTLPPPPKPTAGETIVPAFDSASSQVPPLDTMQDPPNAGERAPTVVPSIGRAPRTDMGVANASLEILAFDADSRKPRPGLRVSAWCESCEVAPAFAKTEAGGVARFEPLLPGEYKVVVYAPGGTVDGLVRVPDEGASSLRLLVPRDPYEPSDDKGRMNFPGFRGPAQKQRAEALLAVGGVLLTAGAGMAVGAIVERVAPGCPYESCSGQPRQRLVRGLAIGAAATTAAAAVSLSVGAVQLRRWRFGASAGARGAAVSLRARF